MSNDNRCTTTDVQQHIPPNTINNKLPVRRHQKQYKPRQNRHRIIHFSTRLDLDNCPSLSLFSLTEHMIMPA